MLSAAGTASATRSEVGKQASALAQSYAAFREVPLVIGAAVVPAGGDAGWDGLSRRADEADAGPSGAHGQAAGPGAGAG